MTDLKQAAETFGKIYRMLEDQESKDIFMNRLSFEISSNDEYLYKIINTFYRRRWPGGWRVFETESGETSGVKKALAQVPEGHPFVLYGAGNDGKRMLSYAKDKAGFAGFCSSTKVKQENGYLGFPVMSPEELLSRRDLYVVISTRDARDELYSVLENGDYPPERIIDGPAYYTSMYGEAETYFGPSFMKFSDEEVFVDAGCYDFRTSLALGRRCKCVKKVYAFEPDPESYKRCLQKAENRNRKRIQDVRILPYGVWSEKTTLRFSSVGTQGSSFIGDMADGVSVPVTTIDDVVDPGDRVTTIKMDIEGSELEALKGARETILRDKPKLAICIYHKPEDLWEIPAYINELVPEYRLWIRHHTLDMVDTVLYAVMP